MSLPRRPLRRLLAVGACCLLLGGGYLGWLRDSELVGVERVIVTGVTVGEARHVRAALTAAARSMTTLHVERGELEDAVRGFPAVRDIEVSADFPDALRVRVIEHDPAVVAVGDDRRVPVAGNGTVLRGLPITGSLPEVELEGGIAGDRIADPATLDAVRVAAAAPGVLRARLVEVERTADRGLVARVDDGPELVFGGAGRLRAKWAAAATVLAAPAARGASYVDLRVPGRPAAGGLPAGTLEPLAPAGGESEPPEEAVEEPTATLEPG